METLPTRALRPLRALVDDYRDRCLWSWKRDYYPQSAEEAVLVLEASEGHGDLEGFRRAAEVRRWLSPSSSAASAGS
jgi:hypothetical protein